MNKNKPQKILILGSGGLRIGQAGEFDYSGSQAIKALKQEGLKTVLVNPNIATVQTDPDMADKVYLQPLNVETLTRIIEKEKPDSILLSVGGQTALNLGLALEAEGVLAKHNVTVLGTSTTSIRITEDRELFKKALEEIDVKTPFSITVTTVQEAIAAAKKIQYPIMMRCGFSLGGLGSGKINNEKELIPRIQEALSHVSQILIEEYLLGWKEIEYEIVRDSADNTLTICNMENFDPMGIHTGESIVVAPSQTLTNQEYHLLREIAIKTARHLKIVGECNIQYALDPKSGDYRVIEVNARLSRSSALASKATGYPLAFVATKLALGKRLDEIRNNVTMKTTAFFEPALDYVIVKIPRWDIHKLKSAERTIGSEMKSVGEIMAIGRSFPEALQKGVRMLNIGTSGLVDYPHHIPNPLNEVEKATDRRLFAIVQALKEGSTVETIRQLSGIDPWFLHHVAEIVETAKGLDKKLTKEQMLQVKKLGFSDKTIATLQKSDEDSIRSLRLKMGIKPVVKQIDTLAGEFAAETNYLYMTYHGTHNDVAEGDPKAVVILGSGPYCIGSSVEFDWCAVNAVKTLRKLSVPTVMVNSNPETVSTDYDESDRLYFEEITLERIQDIADYEKPQGIVVCVGGQIANNLAFPLAKRGYHLLGTPADSIDQAENRKLFSSLLHEIGIDQPEWDEVTTLAKAGEFASRVGYPVLLRPSYVLSGAAMNTVYTEADLKEYLEAATIISPDHPVVISKFISNGKELEIDGVADHGQVVIEVISEHIENAGIHSGDATIVIPPQRLYLETIRRCKKITREIVKALKVTGPFNIQFIAIDNAIKVIECNLRAARSFPFVSKATNYNFIKIATEVLMGKHQRISYETLELDHVAVKTPQFSYNRLKGANPVAHVEMASTGEVAVLGDSLSEAFFMSWQSTEQQVKGKRVLLSIGGDKKALLLPLIKKLDDAGWEIFTTKNTHEYLSRNGVGTNFLFKASDQIEPNVVSSISNKDVDLIINIPRSISTGNKDTDGYLIRRLAIDHNIPLITNPHVAQLFLHCLIEVDPRKIAVRSLCDYFI